jgi:hypothetical protein
MGKLRDFGFKPEHSQLLSARGHTAPAVAKALSLDEPAPATKPEPAVARAPASSPRSSPSKGSRRKVHHGEEALLVGNATSGELPGKTLLDAMGQAWVAA